MTLSCGVVGAVLKPGATGGSWVVPESRSTMTPAALIRMANTGAAAWRAIAKIACPLRGSSDTTDFKSPFRASLTQLRQRYKKPLHSSTGIPSRDPLFPQESFVTATQLIDQRRSEAATSRHATG